MDETLRVAVVGAGWPGRRHIDGYRKHDSVEVVALCDMNEERLREAADAHHVPGRYAALDDMLAKEKPDIVSVCTPNALHAEMSIAAMKAGAHVLVEKPMAVSGVAAREMVETSRATGKKLMVGYQRRFIADVAYLKQAIDAGEFGDLYFARAVWIRRIGIPGMGTWFTQKALAGGGALIDIGVHVLDLALWMFGYPDVVNVAAATGSKFGVNGLGAWHNPNRPAGTAAFDVDDFAFGHLDLGAGRSINFEVSWAGHIKEDVMAVELWGSEGGARLFPLEIYKTRNGVPETITPHLRETDPFELSTGNLISWVRGDAEPVSPGDDGVKTVDVIERIYAAAGSV